MELGIFDRVTERKFAYFNDVKLSLRYDSVGSVFSFSFYFNPDNPEHAILAQPTLWPLAKIYDQGKLLLTGFVLQYGHYLETEVKLVTISGYSIPGVLEDCQIPLSAYPLQSDNLSLRQIAKRILTPYKINMDVDDSVASKMDQVYETSKANPTQTVKDYFTELCKQRNIILSHTPGGRVLFTSAKTNLTPIAHYEGGIGNTSISHNFNGQMLHSPITVVRQADPDGGNEGVYTLTNPYIPASTTAFRPKVVVQSSGDNNSTESVARNVLAAELKAISIKVSTDSWYIGDDLIRPNNLVTVQSKSLFLNKKVVLFIESVEFSGNQESQTTIINCVLPEVYNLNAPKNIYV